MELLTSEYLKDTVLSEDIAQLCDALQTNPETILEEYIVSYLDFKTSQEAKSLSQAVPVCPTPITNIVNFSDLEDFDKWIMTPEYKIYLTNIISTLRTIGYALGNDCVKTLTFGLQNQSSTNIYRFDFFTKFSVQPNFLTFQRILYTFGFGHQIFSYEFKKFFTCGHKMIGLISANNHITITLNVDTTKEFFKKLSKLANACANSHLTHLFDEFKVLFGKFKNYVVGLIIRSAINNWHVCGYKINLCLQECDEDLYLYLKDQIGHILFGSNFSPQKFKTYKIDNFIDFAFDPNVQKIRLEPSELTHGFATFTNQVNLLTPIKVFNSLVLSHEKKSLERGFTYTNRGIFIPELNLYNLHLKSSCAYGNLVSLDKFYFDNDMNHHKSIYGLEYSFVSKSHTQMYGVVALANKYPFLTTQQLHHIIDVIYDRKKTFDQVLLDLGKNVSNNLCHANVLQLSNLKEKYQLVFEQLDWGVFVQAVQIHWIRSLERKICKELMNQAIDSQTNQVNPDIIIKELLDLDLLNPNPPNSLVYQPNLINLVICGDINIILKDINETRIKKYSFKSKPTEDEPFNHLVRMQMNSWGNDVIFSFN